MDEEREQNRNVPPTLIVGRFNQYAGGQTPNEMYLADALKKRGVQVQRSSGPRAMKYIRPHTIVLMSGPQDPRLVQGFKNNAKAVIFWTLDAPDAFGRRAKFEAIAQASDCVFSSADWGLRGRSRELSFMRLPAAVPDDPVAFRPNPKRPVAFLGGLYSERRVQIARIVMQLGGEVRSDIRQRLFGRNLERFVQDTKVMIGDNWTNSHEGYWSSRNYILPGVGGFLLTADVPGLDKEFEPGIHLETWSDLKDMEKKAKYFIEHSEPREVIRKKGFEYTRRLHTWDARAKRVIQALEVLAA